MRQDVLERHADECRKMIPEFAGRPEEPFLVQLASAFEQLALQKGLSSKDRREPALPELANRGCL